MMMFGLLSESTCLVDNCCNKQHQVQIYASIYRFKYVTFDPSHHEHIILLKKIFTFSWILLLWHQNVLQMPLAPNSNSALFSGIEFFTAFLCRVRKIRQ